MNTETYDVVTDSDGEGCKSFNSIAECDRGEEESSREYEINPIRRSGCVDNLATSSARHVLLP